jgi:hypothetical protein
MPKAKGRYRNNKAILVATRVDPGRAGSHLKFGIKPVYGRVDESFNSSRDKACCGATRSANV